MGHQKGNKLDKYFYKAQSPPLDRKERVAENKNHNKGKNTNKMNKVIFADCGKSKKKVTVIKNGNRHFGDWRETKIKQ